MKKRLPPCRAQSTRRSQDQSDRRHLESSLPSRIRDRALLDPGCARLDRGAYVLTVRETQGPIKMFDFPASSLSCHNDRLALDAMHDGEAIETPAQGFDR